MINEIRKPDKTLAKVLPPVRLLDGVVYVPSQFTLSFAYKGRDFVCNTLTRQCLETKLPGRCRAGEGYDALIRKLFLVPEGKDECGFYNAVVSMLRVFGKKKDSKGYKGYTILPTLACNARCVYCYEEGMKPVTMAPGTVEQTIRYIVDTHTDKSVGLHWFGGEPLMCPDIIGRICEGLRDAGLHYRSSMVSNGSLITPEILAKMTGLWQLDRIQISMDGAESDYILRKRYINYQDHYHRVLEAIRMLSEAGIEVSIRCNVDEDNFDRIPAFLEDLKDGIPCKEKVRCYLSPLYGIRAGERDLPVWRKVTAARPLIEAAGFSTGPLFGEKPGYRVNHCMADGSGVVIGPDGSLYACEHCPPESRFGDIWQGVTDDDARREFCRVDRTREKCRTCLFLPDCTSFAACPVEDYHCREVRKVLKTAFLCRLVDDADNNNTALGEENLT